MTRRHRSIDDMWAPGTTDAQQAKFIEWISVLKENFPVISPADIPDLIQATFFAGWDAAEHEAQLRKRLH